MPNSFIKANVPSWLSYALTITGITGLTGVILIYIYQCKLIYPASYPEGSRQEVVLFKQRCEKETLGLIRKAFFLGSKTF